MNGKIAVSYSHDSDDYKEMVGAFVIFLIKNGFDCVYDERLIQDEASIDLNEMMLKMYPLAEKVIVILSPGYKIKADKFEGGVGKEFRFINDDILKKKNKYLLVSFSLSKDVNQDKILPNGLVGRYVIDLVKDKENSFNELFAKLKDEKIIEFPEINSNKPIIQKKVLPDFEDALSKVKIENNNLSKKELFNKIQNYLTENKQLFLQFGPRSVIANTNPISDVVYIWNDKKVNVIIPNNNEIINLIEKNKSLLSKSEFEIFHKFKVHANMFEKNQTKRLDSQAVPLFPKEFEELIFSLEV